MLQPKEIYNNIKNNIMEQTESIINIALAGNMQSPVLINPANSFIIDFGIEINQNKIENEMVKIKKLINQGTWISEDEINIKVSIIDNCSTALKIETASGMPFDERELYCIEVCIKDHKLYGYFAVNYTFRLNETDKTDTKRELVVIISDLHLGANDDYTECRHNRKALVDFLKKIRLSQKVKELVIAGDLIDEWIVPGNVDTFDPNHNNPNATQQDFVNLVKKNNIDVFNELNAIILEDKIILTYVPGNHDLLITREEVNSILPSIHQSRDGAQGLGSYTPIDFKEAVIEHGHRYNFFCAPDPYSNQYIAKGSILPPGYFLTRIGVSASLNLSKNIYTPEKPDLRYSSGQSQFLCSLYGQSIPTISCGIEVNKPLVVTNIDHYTDTYCIQDFYPQEDESGELYIEMFNRVQDNWEKRMAVNNVKFPHAIPVMDAIQNGSSAEAIDGMSKSQFFSDENSDKRIVIFGHTHVVRMKSYTTKDNKSAVYANSGTWIDFNNDDPTMTLIVLIPPKEAKTPLFVNLYQYLGGEIELLDARAITRQY